MLRNLLFILLFAVSTTSCKQEIEVEKRSLNSTNVNSDCSEMGDVCWSKTFGGASADAINSIALNGNEIFLCGNTRNSYSVDGVAVDANTTNDEFFTAKCSGASCSVDWINTAGKYEARSFCAGLGVDTGGNVYAGGTYYTNLNVGGGALGNSGDRDMAVVKYNNSGVHQWSTSVGGTAGEELNGLYITPGNDVLVSGFFRATVDFGSGNITTAGDSDAFVAKYNSAGTSQFSSRYGLAQKDYFWDVASDGSNNIYATGEMIGNQLAFLSKT